jgi:hypothetical protein
MCTGISMKSSSGLAANAFIFGARLIAKARSSGFGAIAPEQAGRVETHAKTAQVTRLLSTR